MAKYALRTTALVYLLFLLVLPVGLICWRTFEHGLGPVVDSLTTTSALHAFKVTAEVAVLAVIANTVFGLGTALLLPRHDFPGKRALNALIDLPIAVSPVVVGLALILGRHPGHLLGAGDGARHRPRLPPPRRTRVVPVLEEIGVEQEQAAWTLGAGPLQAFRRVTLPAIRWALGYGMVLALSRSLGEYGAVAVVSGRLVDQTQTLTLFVEERFQNFDPQSAYAAAFAMALVAVVTLLLINMLRPKEEAL